MKKNKNLMRVIILLGIIVYASLFSFSLYQNQTKDELLIRDVGRLFPGKVKEIVQGQEEKGLVEAVNIAKEKGLKVSIAGSQHSQGGHSFYEDSVWLDMSEYDKVLQLDEIEKTITVQSGITWKQIQDYINPYGLSVKVMQSSNIFTVGGSLSSNVHGRDPKYGTIIETVDSFRLLTADGVIKEVSRSKNKELFPLVIGGYGLFGVILDVTIQLTDDVLYVSEIEKVDYEDYPDFFMETILPDKDVGLHYARLSINPKSLFDEMYTTTFKTLSVDDKMYPNNKEEYNELTTLQNEKQVGRNKFLFGLSRKFDWGKELSWTIQNKFHVEKNAVKITSRNTSMSPLVEFLEYDNSNKTDILQEYFIPIEKFSDFVDQLKTIIEEEELNLLNATVRYTKANKEGFLNYANEDTFAVVLLFNHSLSEDGIAHMKQGTREIVDAALALNGTYYLTYQLFPSQQQIRAAYPNIDDFFEKKREFDPEERFMNNFYEEYEQK